jgi:hypothetical protein
MLSANDFRLIYSPSRWPESWAGHCVHRIKDLHKPFKHAVVQLYCPHSTFQLFHPAHVALVARTLIHIVASLAAENT